VILAAGLSPAWQQIVLLDELHEGEVNRAREVHWCASGKVLNVGLALGRLGAESRTLSLVGGTTGEQIQREFRELGFNAQWIPSANPTRVCTTILDSAQSTTTELVENTAPATAEELAAFQAAYAVDAMKADVVVLSGSLPAGTPPTLYRDLLQATRGKAVLDFRGPELLAALECRPFLVKPNREELGRTFGTKLETEQQLLDAMRRLNHSGAEWVVVTHGKQPVWVTSATQTFQLQPPAAHVVNPIACGDCMAAGIAWGLSQNADPIEAVQLGMAAAADNLSQLLPARLNAQRVHRTAETIAVSRG